MVEKPLSWVASDIKQNNATPKKVDTLPVGGSDEEKQTNEIKITMPVLECLDVQGKTITTDFHGKERSPKFLKLDYVFIRQIQEVLSLRNADSRLPKIWRRDYKMSTGFVNWRRNISSSDTNVF